MVINKDDLALIKKVQAAGNDNVSIGGSLLLRMIGLVENNNDIDIIVDVPTAEQNELINEYYLSNARRNLDFLKKREFHKTNKDLRLFGIPLDNFENIIEFKARRGMKKDFGVLFRIIRYMIENKEHGLTSDEDILNILNTIEDEQR